MVAIDDVSFSPRVTNPARIREILAAEAIGRLDTIASSVVAAASLELSVPMNAGMPVPEPGAARELEDARIHIGILRGRLPAIQRLWEAALHRRFQAWPVPPSPTSMCLLSEGLLASQVLAQPVVDDLERRFAPLLSVISSRYHALSVALGQADDSLPPTAPAALTAAFLEVFPREAHSRLLLECLLRRFRHLAGDALGPFYEWLNQRMGEHGLAMAANQRHGLQVSREIGTAPPGTFGTHAPLGRSAAAVAPGPVALRLLDRIRRARRDCATATARPSSSCRPMSDVEFQAVLSLMQTESAMDGDGEAHARPIDDPLERAFADVASRLGMSGTEVRFSDDQRDAIGVVDALLDALRAEAVLDAAGDQALASLELAWVLLLWQSPAMLDDAGHPARQLLEDAMEALDGVVAGEGVHALAVEQLQRVAVAFNGDTAAFAAAAGRISAALKAHWTRADLVAGRAFQALEGRERREAAQRIARHAYRELGSNVRVRPWIADFLHRTWLDALERIWLRDGETSENYQSMHGLGRALIALDQAATDGAGTIVADACLRLEQALRTAHIACGEDEGRASDRLGELAAAVADPDADRVLLEPVASAAAPVADAGGGGPDIAPGSRVIWRELPRSRPRALRLIGVTHECRRYVFVGADGRQTVLERQALIEAAADGRLTVRRRRAMLASLIEGLVVRD